MTKKPHIYGRLHRLSDEIVNDAKEVTSLLIAALAAPFPFERWQEVEAERLTEERIRDWGHSYDSETNWLVPKKDFAERIQFRPEDETYRVLRNFLVILTASESCNLPFMYVHTLITIFPLLRAAVDFLDSINFTYNEDELREETPWDVAIHAAIDRHHALFNKFYRIRVESY